MDSKEAFEKWRHNEATRYSSRTMLDVWRAACAYQRAQDLAHVEAVKVELPMPPLPLYYRRWVEAACDEIAARITAEEPGKGEG